MKEIIFLHFNEKIALEKIKDEMNRYAQIRLNKEKIAKLIDKYDDTHGKTSVFIEINLTSVLGLNVSLYYSLANSHVVQYHTVNENGWNFGLKILEYVGWRLLASHMTYKTLTSKKHSLYHFLAFPVMSRHLNEDNLQAWIGYLEEEENITEQLDSIYDHTLATELENMQVTHDYPDLSNKHTSLLNKLSGIANYLNKNPSANPIPLSLKSVIELLNMSRENFIKNNQSRIISQLKKMGKWSFISQNMLKDLVSNKTNNGILGNKKQGQDFENEEFLVGKINLYSAFFYNVSDKKEKHYIESIKATQLLNNENNFININTPLFKNNQSTNSNSFSSQVKANRVNNHFKSMANANPYIEITKKGKNKTPKIKSVFTTYTMDKSPKPVDEYRQIDANFTNVQHIAHYIEAKQNIMNHWSEDYLDCFYGTPLRSAITHSNYKLALWLAQHNIGLEDKMDLRYAIKPIYISEQYFNEINMPLLCLLFTTINTDYNPEHLDMLISYLLHKGINPQLCDSRNMDSLDILLHNKALSRKDKIHYLKLIEKEMKNNNYNNIIDENIHAGDVNNNINNIDINNSDLPIEKIYQEKIKKAKITPSFKEELLKIWGAKLK